MPNRYIHQQFGTVTLLGALLVALLIYIAFATVDAHFIGAAVLLVVIIGSFLFGSLIVEVDRTHLRIRFGVGLIRRSWPLKEIASAEVVRNPWYTGWGIRLLPGRTVYNVAGFDAVEITLKNGKCYRIGTNQPQELERAIRSRLKQ